MSREDELTQALTEFLAAAKELIDPNTSVCGYPSYFKLKRLREHIAKTEEFLKSNPGSEEQQLPR